MGGKSVQYKPDNDEVRIEDGDGDSLSEKKQEGCCSKMQRMPKATWPILVTELCERFSYYGIKAVLVLFLVKGLMFDKSRGKSIYHAFSMVSYFTGVFGAMISDSFLGNFKTIGISLVVYSVAEVILTLTSIPSIGNGSPGGPLFGLFLTAVACGNIKPCLAAFGGDQFDSKESSLIAKFFSMFYMAVNVGATFTMIFMPMIRTDVRCFGGDCYPATFGVPAIFIIIATLTFFAASRTYKKKEPTGNMMIQVIRVISHAISNKITKSTDGAKYEHWLYHAQDKYSRDLIEDIRSLLRVLTLYIPLPVFWALFHQQGSSWTLQAEQMDGDLGSFGQLRSDQIQFFNPVLVLILIPLYDAVIYPIFERCQVPLSPLKRMVGGMILAGLAFVVCGLLQIKIQTLGSPPAAPAASMSSVEFINMSPCQMVEVNPSSFFKMKLAYGQHESHQFGQSGVRNFTLTGTNCFSKKDVTTSQVQMSFGGGDYHSVFINTNENNKLVATVVPHNFMKPDVNTANSFVRIIYGQDLKVTKNINVTFEHKIEKALSMTMSNVTEYHPRYTPVPADEYGLVVTVNNNEKYPVEVPSGKLKFGTFGSYTLMLVRPQADSTAKGYVAVLLEDVKSNSVHRIWQLPQYIVLTAGEVMFAVTGLEFAYSQAPTSMKSVLQACWLLTVAFGDLLVVIFSEAKPVKGVEKEMFLYGGFMGVVTIIFAIMAYFYTYSDFTGIKQSLSEDKIKLEDDNDDEKFMMKDENGSTTPL